MKIPVNVKRDHIEALVASTRPLTSLAELIWNALDADAKKVTIRFKHNALGALEEIRVTDDGTGMTRDDAEVGFGSLGGSWKINKRKTPGGRNLHGKSGKGRFRAFALGELVDWFTIGREKDKPAAFRIRGTLADLSAFDASDARVANAAPTGTEVTISNLRKNFTSLTGDEAPQELSQQFAIYLSEYPSIVIDYNGVVLDPSSAQARRDEYELDEVTVTGGVKVPLSLSVIEWTTPVERALHLCDEKGISLHSVPPSIQAPGYQFTAYLRSPHIRELDQQGLLTLDELHSDVSALMGAAKGKLRDHFRIRAAEDSNALVEEWKREKVYPYEGEPENGVEAAERQVFDVVAVNINAYLTDFDEATPASKRFTFKLVKEALKENPDSLQRIFEDVLNLPKERQDDLAELLQKTSLPALISSARLVANRLDFLRGLEILLFDKECKQQLLERDQLHQVLAKETWIFGENFHLTNNEESLNEVLTKYLAKLGTRADDDSPVTREDGSTGRIDLMLARTVPQPRADEREHLVVELKRPSRKIDTEVISQVKSYAIAVAQDERFLDTKTRWIFWAISNEMTDDARRDARQRGRPEGLVYDDDELRITVWAKTWGQLINDCKARLNFFRQQLEYEADRESAMAYLSKAHEKYLPKAIRPEEGETASPESSSDADVGGEILERSNSSGTAEQETPDSPAQK
jgi:hypothetical protein